MEERAIWRRLLDGSCSLWWGSSHWPTSGPAWGKPRGKYRALSPPLPNMLPHLPIAKAPWKSERKGAQVIRPHWSTWAKRCRADLGANRASPAVSPSFYVIQIPSWNISICQQLWIIVLFICVCLWCEWTPFNLESETYFSFPLKTYRLVAKSLGCGHSDLISFLGSCQLTELRASCLKPQSHRYKWGYVSLSLK